MMEKLANTYNKYYKWLLNKTTQIENYLTSDLALKIYNFDFSMAQVFAGEIEKVAASGLAPNSLVRIVGVCQPRDNINMTSKIIGSLAQPGLIAIPY